MPSYFFHLLFELYPPSALASISAQEGPTGTAQELPGSCFLPPHDFNIFNTKALPDHTVSKEHFRYQESIGGTTGTSFRQAGGEGGEAIPWRLESRKAKELQTVDNNRERGKHIDFRFGRVSVESVDIVPVDPSATTSSVPEKSSMGAHRQPITNNLLKPAPSLSYSEAASNTESSINAVSPTKQLTRGRIGAVTSPPKARFVPLSSKTTEFGYGVVHLYRDGEETQGIYPLPEEYAAVNGDITDPTNVHSSSSSGAGASTKTIGGEDAESGDIYKEALKTVAILAVPSYMTASDFMGFVGEETRENASHFRMIRTGQANRYMVLIKFRTVDKAREFVRLFNGKVFNSMEVSTISPFLQESLPELSFSQKTVMLFSLSLSNSYHLEI